MTDTKMPKGKWTELFPHGSDNGQRQILKMQGHSKLTYHLLQIKMWISWENLSTIAGTSITVSEMLCISMENYFNGENDIGIRSIFCWDSRKLTLSRTGKKNIP